MILRNLATLSMIRCSEQRIDSLEKGGECMVLRASAVLVDRMLK